MIGMKTYTISLLLLSIDYSNSQTFDRRYVGVAFGPYTKGWVGNQVPWFNSYSLQDIKQMLTVINSKFQSISTYRMGVTDYNVNNAWDQTDSDCLVARAAAQINQNYGQTVLRVSQGIYQFNDNNLMNKEIQNAFSAAQDANGIFPNTVWSLTFTNEYFTDVASGQRILGMIQSNKAAAQQMNLKVGTRIHICGVITGSDPNMKGVLADIVSASDFIMCNLFPVSNVAQGTIQDAVNAVNNAYYGYVPAFKAINPNIQIIIGETGWPSEGISFNGSPNNAQNLRNYWTAMGNWASQNQVLVHIFEAFDEPWKSNKASSDLSSPSGPNGAEGHYGFWKRVETGSGPQYVEK